MGGTPCRNRARSCTANHPDGTAGEPGSAAGLPAGAAAADPFAPSLPSDPNELEDLAGDPATSAAGKAAAGLLSD